MQLKIPAWPRLLPILLGFSFSMLSHATECQVFQPWLEIIHAPLAPTIALRSAMNEREYQLKQESAFAIYQSYTKNTLPSGLITGCLPSEVREDWLNTLSQVFLEKSIQNLSKTKLPAILKVLSEVERLRMERGAILFRTALHYPQDESVESQKKAGVYRGSESLFMNVDRIHPNEWNFLLVHELTHYTDAVLQKASDVWGDRELARKIFDLSVHNSSLTTLSVTEKALVRSYIQAGLDRGLLAEYRAWVGCFSSYQAGKTQGLWGEIPWMEEIVSQKLKSQSWESFTLQYLDRTFTDPEFTGIFSLEIVKETYLSLREELRTKFTKKN
jgi:hypothetical protein